MEIINQEEYERISKNGLVVINFSAPWCPDCVRIEPIMKILEEEYTNVKFFKVDIDKDEALKDLLHIRRIPTLLFLKDGVEVSGRLVEPDNKMPIKQAIESMLA